MNRTDLFASIVAAGPGSDDVVYLERRGDAYAWHTVAAADQRWDFSGQDGPDVWMYFHGAWPLDDPARLQLFFDDLLEELESMAGGADRCRWPLDEPWPHTH
ncbi:MAG TPA: hypothetical protein VGM75_10765 [Pseudonocardiaceae bacterium]